MNAVFSLCLANLRKKKVQNGLIGLLILLSTLLLATAVTVILNSTNAFTDMHKKTNGSHEILILGNELHNPQKVYQWWNEQAGVSTSNLMPYRTIAGMTNKGKAPSAELLSLTLYMMDAPNRPYKVDELLFSQGDSRVRPERGTIWLPTSIAYLYEIAVGDTIQFSTGENNFELKVSAVVVDVPYGAPFPVDARIWMNHEDYTEQFSSVKGKEQYMMGLRYEQYAQSPSYWERFEKDMGTPYLDTKISYGEISSFYLIMNKVIGFIMIFLGVLMVFVALFTIGFTVSDDILSSYKTIGVIKALGLSAKKILSIYMTQYALISIVTIIPGLLASQWVSEMIVQSALSSLKTGDALSFQQGNVVALAIGIFVFALVIGCVLVYSNKARFIQPMQAIRYGMSEAENSKLTKRITPKENKGITFEKSPVVVVIGLRNILKNKKASILMMLLTTIMSAVLVLGFVLIHSISNIKKTSSEWGYDSSDIGIRVVNTSSFSRAEYDKKVLSDPRVENMGWLGYVNGVVSSESKLNANRSDTQQMNFNVHVIDGSYEEIGYTTLRGKNPRNEHEISIGISVAKQLNKDIGDVMDIYIEGHKYTFLVTGIYQSIANQSVSARIVVETFKQTNPNYNDFVAGFINLHDAQDSDAVVEALNAQYKDIATATTMQTLLDATFKQAVASFILPMSLMALLFTGVTILIIYSTSRINIRKESKTYGIYKSIGMTSARIRWSVSSGIAVVSAIGAVIGIVLGVYLLPIILGSVLSEYGIAEIPLVLDWGGIIAFAAITVIAAGIGSWASSKLVNTTSPRILVIE